MRLSYLHVLMDATSYYSFRSEVSNQALYWHGCGTISRSNRRIDLPCTNPKTGRHVCCWYCCEAYMMKRVLYGDINICSSSLHYYVCHDGLEQGGGTSPTILSESLGAIPRATRHYDFQVRFGHIFNDENVPAQLRGASNFAAQLSTNTGRQNG